MSAHDPYTLDEFKEHVRAGNLSKAHQWLSQWIENSPKIMDGIAGHSSIEHPEIIDLKTAQALLDRGLADEALQLTEAFFQALDHFCQEMPPLRQSINSRLNG